MAIADLSAFSKLGNKLMVETVLAKTVTETSDAPIDDSTPYEILPGDTFSGSIESLGDGDVIKVSLVAGEVYRLTAQGLTLEDTVMGLYDSAGNEVAFNDDNLVNKDSEIIATAVTTGTYYIYIGAYRDEGVGTYEVSVENFVIDVQETVDAKGNLSTTYELSDGQVFAGTIGNPADRDAVRVELVAGNTYEIFAQGLTLEDTVLGVFDSGRRVVAFNDDLNGLSAGLTFTATESGTYYLGVQSYQNATDGTYLLSFDDVTPIAPADTADDFLFL